jgi:hypothetical protein
MDISTDVYDATTSPKYLYQNLRSYMIYQIIELHLPQRSVAQSLNQLFGFNLPHDVVTHAKTRASQLYKGTYEGILKKIVNGRLAHADETKISIEGKNAFVWSLTNLEEAQQFPLMTCESQATRVVDSSVSGATISLPVFCRDFRDLT